MGDGNLFRGIGDDLFVALVIQMLATGVSPRWQTEIRLPENGQFIFETAVSILLFMGILMVRSLATSDFVYFQF